MLRLKVKMVLIIFLLVLVISSSLAQGQSYKNFISNPSNQNDAIPSSNSDKNICASHFNTGISLDNDVEFIFSDEYFSTSLNAIVNEGAIGMHVQVGDAIPCGHALKVEKGSRVWLMKRFEDSYRRSIQLIDGSYLSLPIDEYKEGNHTLWCPVDSSYKSTYEVVGLIGKAEITIDEFDIKGLRYDRRRLSDLAKNGVKKIHLNNNLDKKEESVGIFMRQPMYIGKGKKYIFITGSKLIWKPKDERLAELEEDDIIISLDGKEISYNVDLELLNSLIYCRYMKWGVIRNKKITIVNVGIEK